jgi:hypothetical protein
LILGEFTLVGVKTKSIIVMGNVPFIPRPVKQVSVALLFFAVLATIGQNTGLGCKSNPVPAPEPALAPVVQPLAPEAQAKIEWEPLYEGLKELYKSFLPKGEEISGGEDSALYAAARHCADGNCSGVWNQLEDVFTNTDPKKGPVLTDAQKCELAKKFKDCCPHLADMFCKK